MPLSLPESTRVPGPLHTFTDVLSWCGTPWGLEGYSSVLEHNYLLLDVAGIEDRAGNDEQELVAGSLRQLPCPVIGVGAAVSPALLRGLDVVVANTRDAAVLVKNINACPVAAMTLVQLLRHNEDATAQQGLFAESLAYASLQGGAEFARAMQAAEHAPSDPRESASPIALERRADALYISLNRPRARNAYSTKMRDALYEALQLLKMDTQLRSAVVMGEGSCFCTGGDLSEFGTVPDAATAHAIRSSRSVGQLLLQLADRLEFRLHRACVGAGVELPAFAARVVANENTFMQLPEIKLGLLPGAGGTVSILRRIGRQRTAYLALSARRINAATALRWGLVDEISEREGSNFAVTGKRESEV